MSDRISHEFAPVFNEQSRILILGTFPSVKSREQKFYYGHPQNRFWKVIARLVNAEVPLTIAEKKMLLLDNKIAVWDVLAGCEIRGAEDSSIRNPIPNDMNLILEHSDIQAIFTTGTKAARLYKKYCYPQTGIQAISLPSTSPANCRMSYEELYDAYAVIKKYL